MGGAVWRSYWHLVSRAPRQAAKYPTVLLMYLHLVFFFFFLMFIHITNTGGNLVIYENLLIKYISHRDKAKHPATPHPPSSAVTLSAVYVHPTVQRKFLTMKNISFFLKWTDPSLASL